MKKLLSLFFFSLSVTLFAADACRDHDKKCDQDTANKHDHDHAAAPKAYTMEELFTVQCEHKIPHYTCDECRYELGLVKLDSSVIRTPSNASGLVTIETVQKQQARTLLSLNGEIRLNASAVTHVSPRIPGIAGAVYAEPGKRVEKGEVLFEIESVELGRAVGAYRKNRALTALALKNLERENALVAQKLSPESDRAEAQMKYDEFRIELEASENALSVMGLDAEAIATLTSDAHVGKRGLVPVRAPQSGTIIEMHITPGEAVEIGKDLMTIADLSSVWVWMHLYEQDLVRLLDEAKKAAPRVRITTGAFPGRAFEGVIDLIGSVMEEDSRTVKVRAVLKNPDALLRPGMFCEADVVFETGEKVIAVPKDALLSDEGEHFVFRLIRDGFTLRTEVEVGRDFADSVEITRGLAEGEKIATRGAFVLKSDVLRAKMGAGCAD
jgi:cobalt-zinc-cadmium efflux system membrane fusion protein